MIQAESRSLIDILEYKVLELLNHPLNHKQYLDSLRVLEDMLFSAYDMFIMKYGIGYGTSEILSFIIALQLREIEINQHERLPENSQTLEEMFL